MAGSVNRAMLIGEIGKPPTRVIIEGRDAVSFSLATKQLGKNNKEKTDWHRVVVRNDQLIEIASALNEGQWVWVAGQVQTRKFQERYVTEVVVLPFRGELRRLDSRQPVDDENSESGPPDEIPF